jgi:hypothetical protein
MYHYLFIYHYVPLIINQFYVIIINDTDINMLLYLKEMSWLSILEAFAGNRSLWMMSC